MKLRRILPWALFGLLLGLVAVVFYRANQPGPTYPQATIEIIVNGEQAWYESGVPSYRLTSEVEFSSEHRRHVITVIDYEFSEGTTEFASVAGWSAPVPMDAAEANFLTVIGLYSTVRSALFDGLRQDILMQVHESGTYPEAVYLGEVIQDGFAIPGTETTIRVVDFEILD